LACMSRMRPNRLLDWQRHCRVPYGACGQCGRAMVGELKKGRYVYYHCPCASPYVREELLEAEFTNAVRQLVFTPEFLTDAKQWLQQANGKEIREREEVVVRLQAERTKLERRIEAIYEDKLDGVIDEAFYRRKTDECRAETARLTQEIERQQKARLVYVDNLPQLAARAAELFERQPASEKRKLLRFLVEECKWTKRSLTYRWKPPFDRVAEVEKQRAA
jgi:site-specific DNA recombinase